ncbi:MAG: acyl carrier protein [Dorea sp.]|jgi:acyl carrier protein|nr:acyl carrier protein [Dorea sp.]
MSNIEKYNGVFTKLFEISEEEAVNLKYQDIDAWDSVGHMTLVSEIEEVFGIDMDADDIIDFESYEVGKNILEKNYKIEF